jgi:hypothetical protein
MARDSLTGQMGLFTKENLKAMKSQVSAVIIGLMDRPTRVKLEMGWGTVSVSIQTVRKELTIQVNGLKGCDTAKALFHTIMVLFTKDNGREEWNGAKVKWLIIVETTMKENGVTTKETAKEQCGGWQAVRSMKEIGKTTFKVALEYMYGLMSKLIISYSEIGMLDTGNLGKGMVKERFITLTEANMKENGRKT